MNATVSNIQIGDAVKRAGSWEGTAYAVEIGDVVEKDENGRCRVAWRDRQVPSFYRPEEVVTRPGKRTWVHQSRLVKA